MRAVGGDGHGSEPLAALAGWICLFTIFGLYERQSSTIVASTFDETATMLNALMAGSLIMVFMWSALIDSF